jgi:hypothetical protein
LLVLLRRLASGVLLNHISKVLKVRHLSSPVFSQGFKWLVFHRWFNYLNLN